MQPEHDKEIERQLWWDSLWRAQHTMRYQWRATFLLITLLPVLHVPWGYTALVVIGYHVCHLIEHWQKQKALDAIHEEEFDWQPDPNDPELQENGYASRLKLSPEHQAMVYRTGDYLRRML